MQFSQSKNIRLINSLDYSKYLGKYHSNFTEIFRLI